MFGFFGLWAKNNFFDNNLRLARTRRAVLFLADLHANLKSQCFRWAALIET